MGNISIQSFTSAIRPDRTVWKQLLRMLFNALVLSAAFTILYFIQIQYHFISDSSELLGATLQFGVLSFCVFTAIQLVQLFSVKRVVSSSTLNTSTRLHKLTQYNDDINRELAQQAINLNQERNRVQSILDNTQAIIMTVRADGAITRINRFGEKVTGFTAEELEGKSFLDLYADQAGVALKDLDRMSEIIHGERETYRHESTLRCKDGNEKTILWSHSRLAPESGELSLLLCAGLDITEHKQLELKLSWLADHDSLTSLFNRRRFEKELEQAMEWAHGNDVDCALLYIDLDNFKDVNDSCGHQAGDSLLLKVAGALTDITSDIDASSHPIAARIGGDEFAMILRQVDLESVQNLSDKILHALGNIQHSQDNIRFQLSCSIGVAVFPGSESGSNDLLSNADYAMYQAKLFGRNQYYIFRDEDAERNQSQQRMIWRERIETAIREQQLILYYQPILNIQTRTISHYETLVRLLDENGQLVSPETFINMAEKLGMIQEIDHFILDSAIARQGKLLRQGHDITLAINLSGKAFDNPNLYDQIVNAIERHKARADKLIFEITETAAVSDILAAEKIMSRIQALGCQFALDDFGVGFSSFYYLRELPVEYVKIDGSFVKDLVNNTDNIVLVKALSEVAIGFNKLSVAEFVDSLQTLHILSEAKVNYAQGYFIGKPSQKIPVDPPNFYQASINENTALYH